MRVIIAVSVLLAGISTTAWQAVPNAPLPKFDAVSVKPCGPKAGGGGRGGTAQASPVHFYSDCLSVDVLIRMAYVTFAGGRINPPSVRPTFDTQAAPDWIRSERFVIEATTSAVTPIPVMHGPMLQAVLEDRFKLKMRRETRDMPVFDVVVARGGSKLTPFTGTCVPQVFAVPAPPLESGQRWCTNGKEFHSDGSLVQTVEGMTLDDWLSAIPSAGGPLVNKTGITGLQTFRFVWSSERGADFPAEIKQLGLELRAAQGPREFLILEHVDRPVPDGPVVAPAR